MTNKFEKPFQHEFGADLSGLLFELADDLLEDDVNQEIAMALQNWEPRAKLLNVQSGEYTEVSNKYLGKKSIKVKNENLEADSYQILAPKINIQLWYKESKEWVKLESITPDNHHIVYTLK